MSSYYLFFDFTAKIEKSGFDSKGGTSAPPFLFVCVESEDFMLTLYSLPQNTGASAPQGRNPCRGARAP
jgi:hypothetical protein